MQARFTWFGIGPSCVRALICAAGKGKQSLFHNDPIIVHIHSSCSLSYDRAVASSNANSPQGTIECFLFQFLVFSFPQGHPEAAYGFFPRLPVTSNPFLYRSLNNEFLKAVPTQVVTNPVSLPSFHCI